MHYCVGYPNCLNSAIAENFLPRLSIILDRKNVYFAGNAVKNVY